MFQVFHRAYALGLIVRNKCLAADYFNFHSICSVNPSECEPSATALYIILFYSLAKCHYCQFSNLSDVMLNIRQKYRFFFMMVDTIFSILSISNWNPIISTHFISSFSSSCKCLYWSYLAILFYCWVSCAHIAIHADKRPFRYFVQRFNSSIIYIYFLSNQHWDVSDCGTSLPIKLIDNSLWVIN